MELARDYPRYAEALVRDSGSPRVYHEAIQNDPRGLVGVAEKIFRSDQIHEISIPAARGERPAYRQSNFSEALSRPALEVYPTPADDWNGAFSAYQRVLRHHDGEQIYLPGPTPASPNVPATKADLPTIAFFRWHGSPNGFDKLSTREAAQYMAKAVTEHNAALQPGDKQIKYVLLDACNQGTKRVLALWGTTNANEFRRELNAELVRRGQPPVEVLAMRDAGSPYGRKNLSGELVNYVTPDFQRGRWDKTEAVQELQKNLPLITAGAGLVGVGVGIGWFVLPHISDVEQNSPDDSE